MSGACSGVKYVHHEWVRADLAELMASVVLQHRTTLSPMDGQARRLVRRVDGDMAKGVAMPSRLVAVVFVAEA